MTRAKYCTFVYANTVHFGLLLLLLDGLHIGSVFEWSSPDGFGIFPLANVKLIAPQYREEEDDDFKPEEDHKPLPVNMREVIIYGLAYVFFSESNGNICLISVESFFIPLYTYPHFGR